MLFYKKKYFLNKTCINFDIFFCELTNILYISEKYLFRKISFSLKSFIGSQSYVKLNLQKFLFLNNSKECWLLFWKCYTLKKNCQLGYFVELDILGLGYRIKKINNFLYRFFWGYATFLYLFVPDDITLQYSFDPKKIFIFGINSQKVNALASYFLLLKNLSSYRLLGIVKPNKIIRLRSGKQR